MNYGKKLALAALLSMAVWTSCAHRPKPNPSKADVYFQNWQEAEKELDQCVQEADRLAHP